MRRLCETCSMTPLNLNPNLNPLPYTTASYQKSRPSRSSRLPPCLKDPCPSVFIRGSSSSLPHSIRPTVVLPSVPLCLGEIPSLPDLPQSILSQRTQRRFLTLNLNPLPYTTASYQKSRPSRSSRLPPCLKDPCPCRSSRLPLCLKDPCPSRSSRLPPCLKDPCPSVFIRGIFFPAPQHPSNRGSPLRASVPP